MVFGGTTEIRKEIIGHSLGPLVLTRYFTQPLLPGL
jgi:ribosomal protein S19